jgi:DNA-binding FrmR family transcriptional regulator
MDGHVDDTTRQLVNRWKSIEWHVRGVERMIANEAYCIDVRKQTLAIQGAIEKVNAVILEHHLHSCVTSAIRGDDPDQRELLDVVKGSGHLRRIPSSGGVLENVAAALSRGDRSPHDHACRTPTT